MTFFQKNKKNILGIILSIALIFIGAIGQIQGKADKLNPGYNISEPSLRELYNTVLYHLKNDYVEEITEEDLWFGAIRGLLSSTKDAHTRFMTPDEFNELDIETRGNFGGLGIEISLRDGVLTVVSPIEGTPAMRAGLKPADKIIKINKESTQDMSLAEAVKRMRGKPGTSVNITVLHLDDPEPADYDIVREIIKIKVVSSGMIKGEKIGYVKLKQFSKTSPADMARRIDDLKKQGATSLILDLRWNPGGLLDAAFKISNFFIKEGTIVSTKGRKKGGNQVFRAHASNAILPSLPIVVLVNEGSASASEIVTGAIKDHKRGTIVGTKTFGKGSVQRVIPLMHRTGIALTIQKYYTPSGESIHKKGIIPNHIVESLKFTTQDKRNYKEIREKKLVKTFTKKNKEYNNATVKKFKELLKTKDLKLSDFAVRMLLKQTINEYKPRELYDLEFDVQLKKAIEILN